LDRAALSSRRIPETDKIEWPGKRRTSSRQIGDVFNSDVQNRQAADDHGMINFTVDNPP
jgi:hypothetical protein